MPNLLLLFWFIIWANFGHVTPTYGFDRGSSVHITQALRLALKGMFPSLFMLLQWVKVKRAVRATKYAASDGAATVKQTAVAIKNKARKAKNAISRAAKASVLSLPGISTINLPEPPFPHLLQSNFPPSDSEAIDILSAVSAVEAQSLRLQEIQELGTDRITKHELDHAHQFVLAHKGVLSAIRRIPSELLEEIFLHVAVPWTNSRWNTIPWALSQVCQLWRTTALSLSCLWSRLPTIYLHKKVPSSYAAQIRELLVRSRDAPISFYLYAPFKELNSHPIIDALVLHSERWQTVAIDTTTPTIFAFKGIKGRLSSLRKLSLDVWRQTNSVVFDMFEDAPQLREVSLDGPFPGEVRLPFSQLTRYKERVRGRGMADFTISLATSLTTLEISRLSDSPDIPVTTLPLLVTLRVQFDDVISQGFFENVTLPAIQEILIAGFEGHLITVLTAMISRSHSPCMLKKFAFRTSELDSGELTTLLRLTPHLIDLNLPLPPPEDLRNLIIGRNSRPLVPLLQMLTFEAVAVRRGETSQALNALAVSRCHQNTGLTPVAPGDVPLIDHRTLKELRVVFRSSRTCHYELKFLENWVQSEESIQLEVWKGNLLREVPELEGRPVPRRRKFDLKWCERVFDILSDIEKFQINNVNDIYISDLHTVLRRFTTRQLGRSVTPQFEDMAREILEKWIILLELHLKDRRWVLKGDFSLVYLSPDGALRKSSTDSDIIYGMKESMRFREMFWPLFMLNNY